MATRTSAGEKIGRIGQRRPVILPREFLETLQIPEGDFVAFKKRKNGVLIEAKRVVNPDDSLTPVEAKKVRHGLKQIREGKTKPWTQLKNELGL